ncbi:beta-N-acetylhexosaminidase [Paenalcaligenes faecalis]|uniref:beta-N-acetylhexosaminidase n=1 Tax=Paenalcaligenes faecalis TaxID=2980099 RepID=UPI0022B942DC|nr:beta-N-acetylhexosaminidase [Paenalcaligenes faecalis]
MVDVEAYTLTEQEKKRLQHPLVGGVILFARNFQNREQLQRLCAEIRAVRQPALLIAVDHEGGRVQRFKDDGFTHLPAMRDLGRIWDSDPSLAVKLANAIGYILAAELRACGVDLSFTPVLDLDYECSAVIGNRAFHSDPQTVARLAEALSHGLQQAGMAACGKHFPGHGAVEADSHHEIPVDNRDLQTILDHDAAPYGWLGGTVIQAVMPAHVIYPQVDDKPAGFSPYWIQRVLRQALAYNGMVFSDDLTMEGATVAGDILARANAALTAGCDMVLVCNRPDLADELLARLDWTMPEDALQRLNYLHPIDPALDWDSLQADEHYQQAQQLRSEYFSTPAA